MADGLTAQPKILIADDDLLIREMLTDVLRDDFQLFTAQDGEEALELLQGEEVDLILTDHVMPGVTGIDVLEQALAIQPRAVRMLITATDDVEDLQDAVNRARVHRFVLKPVRGVELLGVVKGALREAHLERENERLVGELQAAVATLKEREKELERELKIRTQELRDVMSQLLE